MLKIPVLRLNFPRLSAQAIFRLSTSIFRKYPSQAWYICSVFHIKPYFIFNQPNSATSGAETAYHSTALYFYVISKLSLLVLVFFFFLPFHCLSFFNLRLSDYPFSILKLFLILLYNHRHLCHFASTFKFKL